MTDAATRLTALAERLELWPVERLRPYERNPRTHGEDQVARLAASMVAFGSTNPILVDEADGILAGHGRLLAARRLGLKEVPVVRLEHLSAAQKRAYVVADDQLAATAGWDETLLAEELGWVRDERFDLDLLGFDATELSGCWRSKAPGRRQPNPRTRCPSRRRIQSRGRAISGSWESTGCSAVTPRCWPTSSACSAERWPTCASLIRRMG